MAILPNINLFFNPILEYFDEIKTNGKSLDCKTKVIEDLNLTNTHIEALTKNGSSKLLDVRITWIITYLTKAELLIRPRRGYVQITEEGTKVLSKLATTSLTTRYLKDNYPEFREFMIGTKSKNSDSNDDNISDDDDTINNYLQADVAEYYSNVESLLLEKLFKQAEEKSTIEQGNILEDLSVELFEKMGYYNAVKTGGSGDGGIDGHFSIDKFGLEKIAFQCKFFQKDKPIASKDIDAFAGALTKTGFLKGVFITTSRFSRECEYSNITLIDGIKLAKLMREHEINCSVIKKNYLYDL